MRNPYRDTREGFSPRIHRNDALWTVTTREPLRHPLNVMVNRASVLYTFNQLANHNTLASRLLQDYYLTTTGPNQIAPSNSSNKPNNSPGTGKDGKMK